MELKRVIAVDSRAANEKAIQLYGENVLVISSERVDNQTELIVAVDLEPTVVDYNEAAAVPSTKGVETARIHTSSAGVMPFSEWLQQVTDPDRKAMRLPRTVVKPAPAFGPVHSPVTTDCGRVSNDEVSQVPPSVGYVESANDHLSTREVIALVREEFETLRKELRSGRTFMAVDTPAVVGKTDAVARVLFQIMAERGVPIALRTQLLAGLENCDDVSQALDAAEATLAKRLARCGEAAQPVAGRRARSCKARPSGRPAASGPQIEILVGPSGCGKTSMVVRLAVEAAMQRGANSQAIVSFRDARPGAWSQLQALAALAGLDCWRAQNEESLRVILSELAGHHTVWVDTSGTDFIKTAQTLQQFLPEALIHVVLPLDAGLTSVERVLARPPLSWTSLIISKADESGYDWPLISTLCAYPLTVSRVGNAAQMSAATLPFDSEQLAAKAFAALRQSLTNSSAEANLQEGTSEGNALALSHSTLAQRAATVEASVQPRAADPAPHAASRKRAARTSGSAKQ